MEREWKDEKGNRKEGRTEDEGMDGKER